MIERVINFLKKYNLQDKTLLVGFSGGHDSMCLLDVLSKISKMEDFSEMQLIAIHFNHNWRGDESFKEQLVCKHFAEKHGIEFYTQTAPVGLKKTENDARIARYNFFDEAYYLYDADAVLTAHNSDDNAETILYRIIKGTGLIGLKGIAEKRGYYYRPLLTTTRKEIEKYSSENNLIPNCDSSNSDINYNRNYIRLNILPALEKINPSVKEAVNTLSLIVESENSIIDDCLCDIRQKVFDKEKIKPNEYKILSPSVKKRLILEFLQKLNIDYDYKKVIDIYNFIEENIHLRNGKTFSLATALWLYVDEKNISVIPPKQETKTENKEIMIDKEGEYQVNSKILTIKPFEQGEVFVFPEATENFVYVDLSEITYPITLRTRKEGDIINPFGMTGSMKLKKYLNAKGVTRYKRDTVLLLAQGNEILWASGVGLSNKIAVKEQPTHVIELR